MKPLAGLQLRVMRADDAQALAEWVAPLMPHAWTAGAFASCLGPNYHSWVLVAGTRLVATLVVTAQGEEGELLLIAVAADYQRQGIARALLEQMCSQLVQQGIQSLWLEVRASNQVAQAVYHQLGFERVSERKDYYPSETGRETAVVMRRQFS